MNKDLPDDHELLTRDRLAALLTSAGFPVKARTLATLATRGGGPPYRLFGTRPLYRWGDAMRWAHHRLSRPRCTTAEHKADAENPFREDGETLTADIPF